MLRLDTHYIFSNVYNYLILKVLDLSEFISIGTTSCAGAVDGQDILISIAPEEFKYIESLNDLDVAGFIFNYDVLIDKEVIAENKIYLSSPQNRQVVGIGDVVTLSPHNNMVRVVYRRGANSNLLFMTDQCNSRCLMCSQPPKEVDDVWHVDENLKIIDLMDPIEEQIGISGGEPTIFREGLIEILKKSKRVLPNKELHILSNGRLLSCPEWKALLPMLENQSITWGIPLYSSDPSTHDYIVQAKGAFNETIKGLYNLHSFNQRIEIRVVLSRASAFGLQNLAYYITRNLPFVRHVAFMGIEPTGLAKNNYDELWIDPVDYQKQLLSALNFLHVRGIDVSIYNLPLCVVDKNAVQYYKKSISDWKNIYNEKCDECSMKDACAGFFKSHTKKWESRGIHPL